MASNNDLADNQAVEELGSGSLSPDSELEVPVAPIPIPSPKPTDAEPSTARPKMVGGFIADDSDDEEGIVTEAASMPVPTTVKEEPAAPPPVQAVPAVTVTLTPAVVPQPSTQNTSVPKARLPHDRTGLLEDRIKEDPRGDMDAWLSLISEHRNRNKLDDARDVYERFFKVFPQAAEIWVQYTEMELENDNFSAAEQIFGKSLLTVPNVQLWSVYLNYIRRVNDLTNDRTGNARTTVSQAYDFVLANIGIDRDSGKIWQEYIQFIHSAPGQIGGSNPSWQDQQKMDQLRKAYQRAICVPMSSVNGLWKEYDQFEMSLNKMTGRKFLQERSPAYMTARSANTALENITRDLVRSTLPRLPPALGFEGDAEFIDQVVMWQKWIDWEQEDPLVLKADELDVYKQRVLYVYKQAVMALRFWPEMWVSAAEWCFSNGMDKEGDTFLNDGISANPESCLLAFKKADRLETTLSIEEADKGPAEKGAIVRAPFDKLLDSLYELIKKLKAREARDITKAEESSKLDASINAIIARADDDDDDNDAAAKESEAAKTKQIAAIKQGYTIQTQLLSRTISFAWIALMRAMRRIQGKGAVKDPIGGSRQIFSDARARGKITSDVYVASALIEHHVYKDAAGTKIFERGAKLFPEDEQFILEYLKHLLSIGDTTNARVAFETAVSRLTAKPENVSKARPLYLYFHKYESQYGELSQIRKLEKRMAELFPNDPSLQRFASRYKEGFDPTAVRPIVSPATQMKPKVIQSIEKPASVRGDSPMPQYQENSPRPQYLNPVTNSPKRPFPGDDFDNPPRKVARGESPLKGAAGRRLDQQKRMQQTQGTPQWQSNGPPPFVIPRDITFLLSIIPRADLYTATKFNAESMVRLLSQTPVPDYGTWKAAREQPVRYDGMLKSKPTHGEAPALPPVVRDAQAVHYGSAADGRRFEDPYLRRSRSPSATPVHGDSSRGSSGHHRNDSGGLLRGRQVLESGTSYSGNQFQDFISLPTAHQRQDRDASRQWEYRLGGFTAGQQRPDSGGSQQWHWQGYMTGDM